MLTEEQILQISNNVSEEFTDHGDTRFATKVQLCEVIQYWQRRANANWIGWMGLKTDLLLLATETNCTNASKQSRIKEPLNQVALEGSKE